MLPLPKIKRPPARAIGVFALLSCLLLSACDTGQLSVGGVLLLYPPQQQYNITQLRDANGFCLYDENFTTDMPVQMSLQTAEGQYVGGAEVAVYADYAENLFRGTNVMAVYADHNSNGVVDGPEELVSEEGDGSFRFRTARHSGSVLFFVRVNLSCAWRGSVRAFAGDAHAVLDIEVSEGGSSVE